MNDIEVWKQHPEFWFVEVSTLSRVRTLDRYIANGKGGRRFVKGHVLKQRRDRYGYLLVSFSMNGKLITKKVHRLVAKTFIPNPNNWPQVNHKDNNPANNCVSNLEWCTGEYNIEYREKFGKACNRPVYAVSLKTLEILKFPSQKEAGRQLGIEQTHICAVVKGRRKQTGGYWFIEDKNKITKDKLCEIKDNMRSKGVFAVNLETLEVFKFESQHEAERELRVSQGNINKVFKGKYKQTGGHWFTYVNSNAVEVTRVKFGDSVAHKVEELMTDKEMK